MKKSLIALATLAAATGASAQSNVTLFGLLDVGYATHTTTGTPIAGQSVQIKSRGVVDGANAGNRIGFRGTENLGGGLRLNFHIEQGINPTNDELFGARGATAGHQIDGFSAAGSAAAVSGAAGAYSNGTNRQTWAGLAGGFGEVRIGYQYTNLYELSTLAGYALGSEGTVGADKAHLMGNAAMGGTRANGLTYISPVMSGIQIRAQYGAGSAGRESFEASSFAFSALAAGSAANAAGVPLGLSKDQATRMSLMVKWDAGPASAALAYTSNAVTQAGLAATANGAPAARAAGYQIINVYGAAGAFTATSSAIDNFATRTAKDLRIGGSYDMKVAKVGLVWSRGENGGSGALRGGIGENTKFDAYNLSISAPFGKTVPFVSMGKASAKNATQNVKTEDYSLTQFGVRHNMSNRTILYVMTGTTKDDGKNAANAAGTVAAGSAKAWTKDNRTVIGVAHSF